jgi:hypothetical protein
LHWEVFEANAPYLTNLSFVNDTLGASAFYDIATFAYGYQVTQDGGANWTDVTPAGIQPYAATFTMVPGSGALVLVVYEFPVAGPFTTLVSTDLGANWLQTGTDELAGWAAFVSPTVGYAGE